jgi:hypothetical protein
MVGVVPTPPESTKSSLRQRLDAHARTRWPHLRDLQVRHRAGFAYISAQLPDEDEPLPLCRLRYTGSASTWGFAIYQASSDRYEDSYLPSGLPAGTPEQALDTACGLYLADPTAWLTDQPPQN